MFFFSIAVTDCFIVILRISIFLFRDYVTIVRREGATKIEKGAVCKTPSGSEDNTSFFV